MEKRGVHVGEDDELVQPRRRVPTRQDLPLGVSRQDNRRGHCFRESDLIERGRYWKIILLFCKLKFSQMSQNIPAYQ